MDKKEIIKDTYNKTARDYYKKWSDLSPLFKRTSQKFLEYVPKGGKVLDLGCGSGRDVKYFSEKGYKLTGVDFSSEMLEIAQEVVPKAKFVNQDIYSLDLTDEFDGVWFSFALLHIKKNKAVRVLTDIKSLLKPGGVLFVATKEGKGEKLGKDNIDESLKMYEVYYSQQEVSSMLEEAGFKLIGSTLDTDRKESDEQIVVVLARRTGK